MNILLQCKVKRFLKALFVMFCMVFGLSAQAQTVTIGTGTTTQRYPLGSNYGYEMSASLYKASELNMPAGGNVLSVAWYSTVAMNFNLPIKIYLKSVPAATTAFVAQQWTSVKSGSVLVYDGTVSNLPIGWNTITLQNQYYYNGTDNLEVLVETNFGGTGGTTSSTGSGIRYSTATSGHMYYYANNVQQGTNGYVSSSRPNIQLTFGAIPACIPPAGSGLTLSSLTTTSAGISWIAPSPVPAAGYEVYYTPSTAIPTQATTPSMAVATGTTATLPLTPGTKYYAWVRSKCSSSSQSTWVGPLEIYTGYCVPSAGTSSSLYYVSKIATTGAWTNLNYTASSYAPYIDNSSDTFTASPGNTINVTLKGAGTYYYYYYVWVDWNNDLDFNDPGETILATTTTVNTGSSAVINVPPAQPYGNYRVRFATSSVGQITSCGAAPSGNYIDYNLAVGAPPTCLPPTALTLNAASLSSATIGWTAPASAPAGGYEIYYNTTNITPTIATAPQITGVTGTSATIPGLTANTTYYIWVRSRCSSADASPWSAPITVYTGYCIPSPPTSTITTYYLKTVTTTGGWTNLNYTTPAYSPYVISNSTFRSSPGFAVNMNLSMSTSTGLFFVWIDWNNDMDFNDPGETILTTTVINATGVATINIPAGQAFGDYRVRCATSWSGQITSCTSGSYGTYADFTLVVDSPPTCLPPTAITVTGVTGNGATIGWAAQTPVPANGYAYYVSTSSTPPAFGAAPTGTSMTNSANLAPTLLPSTTYYWWVRAVCSSSDNSYWAQGPSFMTTQIPATLPYLQNFEGNNDFGFLNGTQTNKWFYGSAAGNTGKSIYISNDSGVSNAYTITSTSIVQAYRDIMIPPGASLATLSFDWRTMGEGTSILYDYLRVWLVSATFMPTPGTKITALASAPGAPGRIQIGDFNQNGTWQSYSNATLNLSSFAGTVMRLVFEWSNNSTGGVQPPAAVDNIVLRICSTETPTVAVSGITDNSATLTWPQDIAGASYKLRYRPKGTTQWLPVAGPIDVAAVSGPTQTFLLQGPTYTLLPNTLYEAEVAAVCNTVNIGVYSHNEFTTLCDPTPPNVNFTNITATSAVVNWSPLVGNATYEMQWRKVGDPVWIGPISLPTSPAAYTLPSPGYTLTPYTQYIVQIRSKCIGSATPNPWSSPFLFTTERTCDTPPPGLTILELYPNSAKIQWEPLPGATYVLRYRKVGIPSWTNVSVSTNIFTLTGLSELTKYEIEVANICSGTPGSFTLPYYFTTPTVVYCRMGAINTSNEYVSKVTVTPNGKPQMLNVSPASNYTDYTMTPATYIELVQGSVNNQITIDKSITSAAGVVAWIDFNRNGKFDINERILVSGPNSDTTASATFNVPSDAFVSNIDYMYVVMRVALMKGALPVNCTNFDSGEVEDYTVRISKQPIVNVLNQNDILIYPNPVSTVLNVKNISEKANYKLYNAAGQLVSSGIILNNKIDVHMLINGVYVINIQDGSTSVHKKFIKE
ncbi:GEVED domain-containing protein [Chryseobacterium gwangjuense]|uniref:GEVED domain-containing protein n=1 Tax=Chryseobacterium gwangjuense TaxID=1069980 RepID=UPI001E3AA055|nr:GEVED domain-containing protein [Chryseobacterium gwangjuense]MCE3076332.1 GEVED domain-containing protein [Chryseobacterium gwangjuense]